MPLNRGLNIAMQQSNSLQIKHRCDIIFMMKKFLFAVCSICIAASAVASPLSAFAAEGIAEPDYPEIFDDPLTFENLTDFAIADDNLVVFADGQTIVHWDKEITTRYEFKFPVAAVDYDAETRNFYYSLEGETVSYILPGSPENLPGEESSHNYDAPYEFLKKDIFEGYHYYYNGKTNVFTVVNQSADPSHNTIELNGHFNAKVYNNALYTISDNYLYQVIGATPEIIKFTFSNFDKLTTIPVGDVPQKLRTYGIYGDTPKYVHITEDVRVTEFDLNLLAPLGADGTILSAPEYFPISRPREQTRTNISGPALLLCESGNARIVVQRHRVFILNAANTTPLADVQKTAVTKGTTAAVNVVGEYAHSLPYMSNATRTFALAPNEVVTVLYEITDELLAHKFYIIENADGERGYVIDEFLGEFNVPVPDESNAHTTPDPDPHTDDRVRNVVIVIVIIMLLLIAAGYITWVCTSNKQKAEKNNDEGEIDLNDEPHDDNVQNIRL